MRSRLLFTLLLTVTMVKCVDFTGVIQDMEPPFDTLTDNLVFSGTVDPKGRYVVAGQYDDQWFITCYLPEGGRDTSFGQADGVSGGGSATSPSAALSLKIDPNSQQIFVVGVSDSSGTPYITFVSYDQDGQSPVSATYAPGAAYGVFLESLIESAAVVGFTLADPSTPAPFILSNIFGSGVIEDEAPGIAFAVHQTPSKVYIAGVTFRESEDGIAFFSAFSAADFTGVKQDTQVPFNTDENGQLYGSFYDNAGKLVVCGNYDDTLILVRYNTDGTRDDTFNGNGVMQNSSLNPSKLYSVAQDLDDNYYVAGEATVESTLVLVLAKYDNTGSLVTTFGNNGISLVTSFEQSKGFGIVLNEDLTLVVAGMATVNGTDFPALFFYNAYGNQIPAFGTQGTQLFTTFGSGCLYNALVNQQAKIDTVGTTGSVATVIQVNQNVATAASVTTGF